VHPEQLGMCSGFPQIGPGCVLAGQAKVTATVEPRCEHGHVCWALAVVVAIPYPYGFLEERMSEGHVGHWRDFRAGQHNRRDLHVRLDHDIGTQCDNQTIRLGRAVHVHGRLLRLLPVQHRGRGVDVGEEEVEAVVHQARREQALGARTGGRDGPAIERDVWRESGGELGIALVLAEFGQHFGAAPLGTLLLGNGIVGAGEAGGQTVLARVGALAYTLDFPAMAAVEKRVSECWGRVWCQRGCGGRLTCRRLA
jgi:hypothetical protein